MHLQDAYGEANASRCNGSSPGIKKNLAAPLLPENRLRIIDLIVGADEDVAAGCLFLVLRNIGADAVFQQ